MKETNFEIPRYNKPVIYAIVNLNTKKVYVGQTLNAKKRAQQHKEALKRGKHPNKELQKDFNNDCKFIILQKLKDDDIRFIKTLEKLYMYEFLTIGFKIYNKQPEPTKEAVKNNIVFDLAYSYKIWENVKNSFLENYLSYPGRFLIY